MRIVKFLESLRKWGVRLYWLGIEHRPFQRSEARHPPVAEHDAEAQRVSLAAKRALRGDVFRSHLTTFEDAFARANPK